MRVPSVRCALWWLACGVAGLGSLPAGAEIKIKTLDDGTRMIYNESTTERARRTADHLLPVPDVSLAALIELHARRQDLHPRLVRSLIQVESGYNHRALSHRGAMGLMQLMPTTARDYRVSDPYDPEQNVRAGTAYLRRLLDRYQSLPLALAAYNAGPTTVERHGGIPPFEETRAYVAKVLSLFRGTPWTSPSALLQEYARTQARERQLDAEERRTEARKSGGGKKVYLTRDENDQIVFTTTPPGSS